METIGSLDTKKNPTAVLSDVDEQARSSKTGGRESRVNPFVQANYDILKSAMTDGKLNDVKLGKDGKADPLPMRKYLGAGFALSDYYCEEFFRQADESQRRRHFGRGLTNDAGTAIATILGLANAGQGVVTGVAAGFGFGDNVWRGYDDAFVVSPDLATVRSLVMAAQDDLREKTLGTNATLPTGYGKAQSVIMRYANVCSTLGIQALLNQSADEQRQKLNDSANPKTSSDNGQPQDTGKAPPSGQPAKPAAAPTPTNQPAAAVMEVPG
jgi:hypothetical protein